MTFSIPASGTPSSRLFPSMDGAPEGFTDMQLRAMPAPEGVNAALWGVSGSADRRMMLLEQAAMAERPAGVSGAGREAHGCISAPLSAAEKKAVNAGDREAFWESRLRRGDPLAETALAIVRNSTKSGQLANFRLRQAIVTRSPRMTSEQISKEVQQIGVELMHAHARLIARGENPDAGKIADYHSAVFMWHGLPNTTFGGTMVTGHRNEAYVYSSIWRPCW